MSNARSIIAAALGVAFALGAAGAAGATTVTPVMSGLDNPRGLAFAPNGALYVTESGTGGPPNAPYGSVNNCALNGANENRCYGPTGAVTRLWRGVQQRVATGLPSHAVYGHPFFPDGSSASGPNHIGFVGTGAAYITLGLGGGETFQAALGAGAPFFGTVIQMAASGRWKVVADVLAHEAGENPEGGDIDSNPYGMLAEPGVRYVTDAGGNSLLAVYGNGRIETVAVFPSRASGRPTDSVPTSVVRGPDEAFYVGELTGVPFAQGAARIYRVVPGQAPEVFLEGFKTIMDLAFDPEGNLYVVENATGGNANPPTWFLPNSGQVTRIAPDGTRTVVASGLNRPTAIVVGPDGELYVTNNSVLAGAGEVLRIDLD